MTRGLRLAPDLELPLDAITQVVGIFARRGAGKTYTASVLVEEVVRARLPVVVLDPLGAWWGLRSSADGTKAGLPVVILGGEHGDVPLEATAGGLIADVVVDHPGAYVLDLSDFGSDAEQDRFVTAFLQRLYRAKARRRDPLLLVMDEADAFVPLFAGRGQEHMVGAGQTVVRRGRIRGIGVLLISQRPAAVHAGVRSQIELLVALQVTSTHDLAAIDDWLKEKVDPEVRAQVRGSLGSLAVGELWASSPAWLRRTVRTKARARETFDSSATPKAGEVRVEPRASAKVNLAALGERIRATAEQAKANDPAILRARIADLERRPVPTTETIVERVEVEVPTFTADDLEAVRRAGADFRAALEPFAAILVDLGRQLAIAESLVPRRPATMAPAPPPVPAVRPSRPKVPAPGLDGLSAYARRLLDTLARRHPLVLTRSQLGLLSGSSLRSSSFDAAIAELRRTGMIEAGSWGYSVGDQAWTEMGGAPPAPQSAEETRAAWRSALPKAEATIFDVLAEAYPVALSREVVSERSGYSPTSSSFDAALSTLRRAGLLEGGRNGYSAAPILFEGGPNA